VGATSSCFKGWVFFTAGLWFPKAKNPRSKGPMVPSRGGEVVAVDLVVVGPQPVAPAPLHANQESPRKKRKSWKRKRRRESDSSLPLLKRSYSLARIRSYGCILRSSKVSDVLFSVYGYTTFHSPRWSVVLLELTFFLWRFEISGTGIVKCLNGWYWSSSSVYGVGVELCCFLDQNTSIKMVLKQCFYPFSLLVFNVMPLFRQQDERT